MRSGPAALFALRCVVYKSKIGTCPTMLHLCHLCMLTLAISACAPPPGTIPGENHKSLKKASWVPFSGSEPPSPPPSRAVRSRVGLAFSSWHQPVVLHFASSPENPSQPLSQQCSRPTEQVWDRKTQKVLTLLQMTSKYRMFSQLSQT